MPLNSEELYGTEADGSKNGDYCRYCMTDGRFTADVTLEEMIELCLPHMSAAHPEITAGSAREMMRRLLPGLKRWRSERD
ncbi:transcriptional regulator [Cloacibacillus porcorum]|nr:transcriptional regulator [Cloacibacillus porcorum]